MAVLKQNVNEINNDKLFLAHVYFFIAFSFHKYYVSLIC